MKALIIYDDFGSAAKANATLQQSAQHVNFAVQWSIIPWRVGMLKFPPTAEQALIDAVDAHLIVFAGRIAQSFPFWLQHWLELWAKCREVEDAALAVFGVGNAAPISSLGAPNLEGFARSHGLSFIFHNNGEEEEGRRLRFTQHRQSSFTGLYEALGGGREVEKSSFLMP
jgi:hypothetical protein